MVLDDGQLVELGSPYDLLQKDVEHAGTWFAKMVSEMGEEASAMLKGLAWEREKERRGRAEQRTNAAVPEEVKIPIA